MSRKTGIVKDHRYLKHNAGFGHPESPQRLQATHEMLETPEMVGKFIEISPRYASHEEIARIHSPEYIDMVAETAGKTSVYLDPDTATAPESYDIAKLAVGGLLNAVDAVVSGELDNAFALIRPPGHHAGSGNAAGFCIFNNVAIAAMHALSHHKMQKVMIVDFDLHHGNGTQEQFYGNNQVLYFSSHQYPYYPGTGGFEEMGSGSGMGFTVNVPLRTGLDDAQYVKLYRHILLPVAMKFKPELILLSAGFDPYYLDPLGGMKVTPAGFAHLTRIIMDIADECCGGKLVVTLEGGYHLRGLAESIKMVLLEMRDDTHTSQQDFEKLERDADREIDGLITRVTNQIDPFWHVFH
jgi:acetoin utilization deacetylase AcuC-like enzyme